MAYFYTVFNLSESQVRMGPAVEQGLILFKYHSHLHPLQAVNCGRNSRLVVDEDD